MEFALNFVVENWDAIGSILLSLHAAALGVVNLTKTPSDNSKLSKAYKVVELIALVTKKAKQ